MSKHTVKYTVYGVKDATGSIHTCITSDPNQWVAFYDLQDPDGHMQHCNSRADFLRSWCRRHSLTYIEQHGEVEIDTAD